MALVFVNLGQPPQSSFARPLALLSECHRRIERFLDDMRQVTAKRRGERLDDADREMLVSAVRYFIEAAPRHTADEEESLFPRLRHAASAATAAALQSLEHVQRLESDHRIAEVRHDEANALASRWVSEGSLDASAAERLAELLTTLASFYQEHLAVEDREVFPAAGDLLSPSELEAIGREMAARRGLDFDRVVAPFIGAPPTS
ncbi:MAG TPA: hemerythrin domain-containing protein [Pirellulales bacterium]|jgi:hemerythrin-like domain-containing protein|nr:hemerythrin domain-containing protein [Pirellulales bacterium]